MRLLKNTTNIKIIINSESESVSKENNLVLKSIGSLNSMIFIFTFMLTSDLFLAPHFFAHSISFLPTDSMDHDFARIVTKVVGQPYTPILQYFEISHQEKFLHTAPNVAIEHSIFHPALQI
jgi:hypothetical protein